MRDDDVLLLAAQLEEDLLKLYGSPLLSAEELQKALGYRSIHALRQAMMRNTVPVKVFKLPNRRSQYALVKDIAYVLAKHALADKEDE